MRPEATGPREGTPPSWRLLDHGPAPGAQNMAVDEAIAVACGRRESPPTLRFYTWDPPAISIGYFQEARREIDLAACREAGLELVRRPTGGKAVLHGADLTYSVASGLPCPTLPGDLIGCYVAIAKGLIAGLKALGVQAQLFDPQIRRNATAYRGSPDCFATALGFEIGVNRQKLIGSAQRRWSGAFLQHGSIRLHESPARMHALFKHPAHRPTGAIAAPTSLEALLGRPVELDNIKACLIQGLATELRIELIRSTLTPYEEALARRLWEEKYSDARWNLARDRALREFRSGSRGARARPA